MFSSLTRIIYISDLVDCRRLAKKKEKIYENGMVGGCGCAGLVVVLCCAVLCYAVL